MSRNCKYESWNLCLSRPILNFGMAIAVSAAVYDLIRVTLYFYTYLYHTCTVCMFMLMSIMCASYIILLLVAM